MYLLLPRLHLGIISLLITKIFMNEIQFKEEVLDDWPTLNAANG